jgi:hypothetical protein
LVEVLQPHRPASTFRQSRAGLWTEIDLLRIIVGPLSDARRSDGDATGAFDASREESDPAIESSAEALSAALLRTMGERALVSEKEMNALLLEMLNAGIPSPPATMPLGGN